MAAVQPHNPTGGQWSTGFCDCIDDLENSCFTLWCPCVTFGHIAEILDQGYTTCQRSGIVYALLCTLTLTRLQFLHSCGYRAKLRRLYGLPEAPCEDSLVHFFCEPCALCQIAGELRNRGYDLEKGWEENKKRLKPPAKLPPSVESGMSRD
ncbi:plant cadmium resistance 2 [Zostera marina]|uniref:Plant cadmium resistance 2 n=1 Tax=Zostera marina TaxID=29655 RepID=A0A0K9NV28_ZOSMR|nr:plant cadmium resistance 2 [Zostera marina]